MTNEKDNSMVPVREILVIEDHTAYRQALIETISVSPENTCTGSFSTVEDALDAIAEGLTASIVLLDLGLPGMDGITGIVPLRQGLPEARLIVLTAFTDREKVFAALEAGAHGYLIKASDATRLMQMLDEVCAGGTPLDPQIAGMVLNTFQKLNPVSNGEEQLGGREIEVLKLVAEGLTKGAIASTLGISSHTVSNYVRRIFDKLHVHSLAAAVSAATRRGLLDFSE